MSRKYFEQMFDEYPNSHRCYQSANGNCNSTSSLYSEFRNYMHRYEMFSRGCYIPPYWLLPNISKPNSESFYLVKRNEQRNFYKNSYSDRHYPRDNGFFYSRRNEGKFERGSSDFYGHSSRRQVINWGGAPPTNRFRENWEGTRFQKHSPIIPRNDPENTNLQVNKIKYPNDRLEESDIPVDKMEKTEATHPTGCRSGSSVCFSDFTVPSEVENKTLNGGASQLSESSFQVPSDINTGYASWYYAEEQQQIVNMLREVNMRHERQLRRDMMSARWERSDDLLSSNVDQNSSEGMQKSFSSDDSDDGILILVSSEDVPPPDATETEDQKELSDDYLEKSASDYFQDCQNIFVVSPEKDKINRKSKECQKLNLPVNNDVVQELPATTSSRAMAPIEDTSLYVTDATNTVQDVTKKGFLNERLSSHASVGRLKKAENVSELNYKTTFGSENKNFPLAKHHVYETDSNGISENSDPCECFHQINEPNSLETRIERKFDIATNSQKDIAGEMGKNLQSGCPPGVPSLDVSVATCSKEDKSGESRLKPKPCCLPDTFQPKTMSFKHVELYKYAARDSKENCERNKYGISLKTSSSAASINHLQKHALHANKKSTFGFNSVAHEASKKFSQGDVLKLVSASHNKSYSDLIIGTKSPLITNPGISKNYFVRPETRDTEEEFFDVDRIVQSSRPLIHNGILNNNAQYKGKRMPETKIFSSNFDRFLNYENFTQRNGKFPGEIQRNEYPKTMGALSETSLTRLPRDVHVKASYPTSYSETHLPFKSAQNNYKRISVEELFGMVKDNQNTFNGNKFYKNNTQDEVPEVTSSHEQQCMSATDHLKYILRIGNKSEGNLDSFCVNEPKDLETSGTMCNLLLAESTENMSNESLLLRKNRCKCNMELKAPSQTKTKFPSYIHGDSQSKLEEFGKDERIPCETSTISSFSKPQKVLHVSGSSKQESRTLNSYTKVHPPERNIDLKNNYKRKEDNTRYSAKYHKFQNMSKESCRNVSNKDVVSGMSCQEDTRREEFNEDEGDSHVLSTISTSSKPQRAFNVSGRPRQDWRASSSYTKMHSSNTDKNADLWSSNDKREEDHIRYPAESHENFQSLPKESCTEGVSEASKITSQEDTCVKPQRNKPKKKRNNKEGKLKLKKDAIDMEKSSALSDLKHRNNCGQVYKEQSELDPQQTHYTRPIQEKRKYIRKDTYREVSSLPQQKTYNIDHSEKQSSKYTLDQQAAASEKLLSSSADVRNSCCFDATDTRSTKCLLNRHYVSSDSLNTKTDINKTEVYSDTSKKYATGKKHGSNRFQSAYSGYKEIANSSKSFSKYDATSVEEKLSMHMKETDVNDRNETTDIRKSTYSRNKGEKNLHKTRDKKSQIEEKDTSEKLAASYESSCSRNKFTRQLFCTGEYNVPMGDLNRKNKRFAITDISIGDRFSKSKPDDKPYLSRNHGNDIALKDSSKKHKQKTNFGVSESQRYVLRNEKSSDVMYEAMENNQCSEKLGKVTNQTKFNKSNGSVRLSKASEKFKENGSHEKELQPENIAKQNYSKLEKGKCESNPHASAVTCASAEGKCDFQTEECVDKIHVISQDDSVPSSRNKTPSTNSSDQVVLKKPNILQVHECVQDVGDGKCETTEHKTAIVNAVNERDNELLKIKLGNTKETLSETHKNTNSISTDNTYSSMSITKALTEGRITNEKLEMETSSIFDFKEHNYGSTDLIPHSEGNVSCANKHLDDNLREISVDLRNSETNTAPSKLMDDKQKRELQNQKDIRIAEAEITHKKTLKLATEGEEINRPGDLAPASTSEVDISLPTLKENKTCSDGENDVGQAEQGFLNEFKTSSEISKSDVDQSIDVAIRTSDQNEGVFIDVNEKNVSNWAKEGEMHYSDDYIEVSQNTDSLRKTVSELVVEDDPKNLTTEVSGIISSSEGTDPRVGYMLRGTFGHYTHKFGKVLLERNECLIPEETSSSSLLNNIPLPIGKEISSDPLDPITQRLIEKGSNCLKEGSH